MYEVWTASVTNAQDELFHSAYPTEAMAQAAAYDLNEMHDADVYAWVMTAELVSA